MKIQYILHANFERPGIIERWAEKRHYAQGYSCPFAGEPCPSNVDFDMLVLMGGPQSPLEIDKSPYLKEEIELVKMGLKRKVFVLGFCLGAQLIGEALGSNTERSPEREIGIFPIYPTDEGKKDPLLSIEQESIPVMHWHNDMPGLTKDAKILAYSRGCPRQIVRYSPFAYGFQCHPEPLAANIEAMIQNCSSDLEASGRFVQSAQELRSHNLSKMNEFLIHFLDNWVTSSSRDTAQLP